MTVVPFPCFLDGGECMVILKLIFYDFLPFLVFSGVGWKRRTSKATIDFHGFHTCIGVVLFLKVPWCPPVSSFH